MGEVVQENWQCAQIKTVQYERYKRVQPLDDVPAVTIISIWQLVYFKNKEELHIVYT